MFRCDHVVADVMSEPVLHSTILKFPTDIVFEVVCWLRYKLSLRDPTEMFLSVDFSSPYFVK
jgi:hypothetical protein